MVWNSWKYPFSTSNFQYHIADLHHNHIWKARCSCGQILCATERKGGRWHGLSQKADGMVGWPLLLRDDQPSNNVLINESVILILETHRKKCRNPIMKLIGANAPKYGVRWCFDNSWGIENWMFDLNIEIPYNPFHGQRLAVINCRQLSQST